MNELYAILYKTYIGELHRLNIGYTLNKQNVQYMFDLINTIDYIENGNPLITEIYKIVAQYE